MPVKLNVNPRWSDGIERGMKLGILEMATDIHRRSKALAPVLTRALVNSGVIEPITDGYRIKYGSGKVPYARRRHFENNKHPDTKGYLAKAGDSVARGDTSKYFKDKV